MFRTLKGKMSVVYIGLVFLIALVGSVSVINLFFLEKSVDGLMTRNYRSISHAAGMLDALENQDKAIITYLNIDEQRGLNDFYTYRSAFAQDYEVDAHNVTERSEQTVINKISAGYGRFEKNFTLLVSVKKQRGFTAAKAFYDQSMLPGITEIQKQLRELVSINQSAMFQSKSRAADTAKSLTYALLLLSLLAVVCGFLLSRYFVGRFLRPVQQLTDGISRVRAGELGYTLNIHTSDETGRLADEFNEMTKRLSVYEKSTMGTLVSERNKSMAIVKSISDPLVVFDKDFRILLLNDAGEAFFHISESAVQGRHFLEAVPNGELFDLISRGSREGLVRREKILHFDGKMGSYYNVVVTQVLTEEKEVTGYILLLQNVTKLKELEQAKADFLATVSHEFKTPLTSIIMGASMLGSVGSLNGEQREILGTMAEDGERLSSFVGELLEISRMEAGKSIFRFERCSAAAISENSLRQFRDQAAARGIALVSTLSGSLPDIYADFEKITWVLNNLLSNALKYTREGDSVTLSARAAGKMLEISVSDTGEGIPEEYLEKIFDRFVQVQGRDVEVRGTGLGLSLAKDIIRAHGGNILAESRLNAGSTFRFTLPVFDASLAAKGENTVSQS